MSEIAEKEKNADAGERMAMENEAYKRHLEALGQELGQIKELYNDLETPEDKFMALSRDVSTLKKALVDLKNMFLEMQKEEKEKTSSAPPQNVWAQPMQAFPQIAPMPMFQAHSLPYIQTPNYAPIMPTLTNQNGGK